MVNRHWGTSEPGGWARPEAQQGDLKTMPRCGATMRELVWQDGIRNGLVCTWPYLCEISRYCTKHQYFAQARHCTLRHVAKGIRISALAFPPPPDLSLHGHAVMMLRRTFAVHRSTQENFGLASWAVTCVTSVSSRADFAGRLSQGPPYHHRVRRYSHSASRGMGLTWFSHAVTWLLTRGQVMPMAGSQATT